MSPQKPPRLQSPTERELASEAARKGREERERDERDVVDAGNGVPVTRPEDFQDVTKETEADPDLRKERRRNRSDSNRLERLEDKSDEDKEKIDGLTTGFSELKNSVAEMRGEFRGLKDSIDRMLHHASEREIAITTKTIEVETTKQVTAIETQAAIEVAKAESQIQDVADARKARRKLLFGVAKVIAIALGGAIVHVIAQKLGLPL